MNKIVIALVSIAAVAATYLIIDYAIDEFRQQHAKNVVENSLTELRAEARKEYPNEPQSVATQKKALEVAEKTLADATTVEARSVVAADQFFGFYFINTRTRRAYCADLGVDISLFIEAFSKAHDNELATARNIYSHIGRDEERMWSLADEQTRPFLIQDVEDTSVRFGLTHEQTCKLYNDAATELAAAVHLSKTAPHIFEALMEMP